MRLALLCGTLTRFDYSLIYICHCQSSFLKSFLMTDVFSQAFQRMQPFIIVDINDRPVTVVFNNSL